MFRCILTRTNRKRKSVKLIQFFCGRLDFTRLCDLQRLRFLCKMSACQNVILKECFSGFTVYNNFEELLGEYDIEYNVNFSLSRSSVIDADIVNLLLSFVLPR